MKLTTSWPSLLVPFALLSGCVDDPTLSDDPDELGETAQEVTSTALSSFTCSSSSPPCNFNLGTATNRACFLSGIRGAAAGSLSVIGSNGTDYILTVYAPSNGVPITVTTTCVIPASNVTSTLWNTNFGVPSVQIPNTTASTRCFLSKFSSQAGGLTNYNDSIRTWRDSNGNWFLGGTRQTGYLSGGAICFDGATNKGEWSWGQAVPGSITGNLASNAGGGVACGLTELGGVFTTNAGSDGVHLGFNSAANQWIWTLVNFKHAFANCIK